MKQLQELTFNDFRKLNTKVSASFFYKLRYFRKYLLMKRIIKEFEKRLLTSPNFVYVCATISRFSFFNKIVNKKQIQHRADIEIGLRHKITDQELSRIDDHFSTLKLIYPASVIVLNMSIRWID